MLATQQKAEMKQSDADDVDVGRLSVDGAVGASR